MLNVSSFLRIDPESRVPKYQQIVKSILDDLTHGKLKIGDRVPSINEVSEEYYLSRHTVEKAYIRLRDKKVIVPVKGKGYYVSQTVSPSKIKVLFLLNKLSNYKLKIFNSFVNSLGGDSKVDLEVYHCDQKIFINILEEHRESYDYIVVMPHFKNADKTHFSVNEAVFHCLRTIPSEKLLVLDNFIPALGDDVAAVYQDFEQDLYNALKEATEKLRDYNSLVLVLPNDELYPYPGEILRGFKKFCEKFGFRYEVLNTIYADMELGTRDAFITITENDLVTLIKQIRDQDYQMGKDVGVISYNDTPLKELLGITVMSTDFTVMGETASYMISRRKRGIVKNVFNFIDRGSL